MPEPELKSVTDSQGNHVYWVQFAVFVYDRYGKQLDEIRNKVKFHVAAANFATVQHSGVTIHQTVAVPDGATVLRILAGDQLGGEIGTVSVTLPTAAN